jgi:hypothetical protein
MFYSRACTYVGIVRSENQKQNKKYKSPKTQQNLLGQSRFLATLASVAHTVPSFSSPCPRGDTTNTNVSLAVANF